MNASLTRVTLASIRDRLNLSLRFGHPVRRQPINAQSVSVFFAPEQVFCRIWWQGNDYGTTLSQLSILQAQAPRQFVQRVSGVTPGAAILLHVEGKPNVQSVLRLIHTIEAQPVDPSEVAPSYWRMVQNRLAGRAEIGPLTADRHAAAMFHRSLQ